jgi:predicted Holliday junction resolvase-like endonuclease
MLKFGKLILVLFALWQPLAAMAEERDVSLLQTALRISREEMERAKVQRDEEAQRLADAERALEEQKKKVEAERKAAAESEKRYDESKQRFDHAQQAMDRAWKQ